MKTTDETTEHGTHNTAYWSSLKALAGRIQDCKRGFQLKLAGSSAGRILLHLALAVVTCRFTWHFHGIARELTRN